MFVHASRYSTFKDVYCRYGKVSPGRGVTSSSSKTRGRVRMARAMATRCFCPPLRRTPRSPTAVWYDCGNAEMKSCAFARRAASSTCPRGCTPTVRDISLGGFSFLFGRRTWTIFASCVQQPHTNDECISSVRDVYFHTTIGCAFYNPPTRNPCALSSPRSPHVPQTPSHCPHKAFSPLTVEHPAHMCPTALPCVLWQSLRRLCSAHGEASHILSRANPNSHPQNPHAHGHADRQNPMQTRKTHMHTHMQTHKTKSTPTKPRTHASKPI
jgi:hypothetical protein